LNPQRCSQATAHVAVALALLSFTASAFAQGSANPSTEKWRPVDGFYESPGKNLDSACRKYGVLTIELAENSVSGFEWDCAIDKITYTAPGTIKLNMTCHDINMPASAGPDSSERLFKEVMLLKRINEKSMSVSKTINGKFKGPAWQVAFCPAGVQQAYAAAKVEREEARKYKVPEQLTKPELWRPRDGVYASPGADFNDRCTKSGDVVIGLTDGSVSSGQMECKAAEITITGIASFSIGMTCNRAPGMQPTTLKKKNGEATPEGQATEIIRLRKIDDNTLFLQKTQHNEFKDDGGPVAYCPEEVQRTYAARKEKK
jgi:hypothetical protein